MRPLHLGTWALVGGLGWWSGCGAPSTRCAPQQWEGQCRLTTLARIREVDYPVPHVELEAVYQPERKPGSAFTPPDDRRVFKLPARDEYGLKQHLEAYPLVECFLEPPPAGTCQPGRLVVKVPEWDRSAAAPGEVQLRGCARLEASAPGTVEGAPEALYTEPFFFETDSASLSPEAARLAEAAARSVASDATIECLSIVGQHTAGESPSLATERARALRRIMVNAGVPEEKLLVLTQSARALGPSARAPEPDPKERRVYFRVMLRSSAP